MSHDHERPNLWPVLLDTSGYRRFSGVALGDQGRRQSSAEVLNLMSAWCEFALVITDESIDIELRENLDAQMPITRTITEGRHGHGNVGSHFLPLTRGLLMSAPTLAAGEQSGRALSPQRLHYVLTRREGGAPDH